MRIASGLVAGVCVLPACIYLSPINTPPTIYGVTRVCDPGVSPCDFSGLHGGDDLQLMVTFIDPEHHEQAVTYEWSALACDRAQRVCEPIPLPNPTASEPELPVPVMLLSTRTPVQLVRVTVELRDDRGAHDSGGALLPIDLDAKVP